MINPKFLMQEKHKGEVIMEQFIIGDNLHLITLRDGIWTLYNHTEGKKICTSKDRNVLSNKVNIENIESG